MWLKCGLGYSSCGALKLYGTPRPTVWLYATMIDLREHWENVYRTKQPHEVSWTQHVPRTSIEIINSLALPTSASVIDVGGGDSTLVDHLLEAGYTDLSVLDISEAAIRRVKERLQKRSLNVQWIVTDVLDFVPQRTYDVWHDRAAFHFLTDPEKIDRYIRLVEQCVSQYAIIATFSESGPLKCSGLNVTRYNESSLAHWFTSFECIRTFTEDHATPFGTTQNFRWTVLKRR